MSNVLTFTRTLPGSGTTHYNTENKYEMSSSDFNKSSTGNISGKIKSIVYNFIFNYEGSSNPIWTGHASIVANDNTEYVGETVQKTITHGDDINVSLTIPEANCPPASVINSGFKIKFVTESVVPNKQIHLPYNSEVSIVVTYGGAQPYVYNGTTWVPATPYVYNGSKWVQASANVYNNGWG